MGLVRWGPGSKGPQIPVILYRSLDSHFFFHFKAELQAKEYVIEFSLAYSSRSNVLEELEREGPEDHREMRMP